MKEAAPKLPPVKNMDALHALFKEADRLTTGLWSDGLTNFQRISKSKQFRKAVALRGEAAATRHIMQFINVPASALPRKK